MKKLFLSIIVLMLFQTSSFACDRPKIKNLCIQNIGGVQTIVFDVQCFAPNTFPMWLWYDIGGTQYGPVTPSYTVIDYVNAIYHYTYAPSSPPIPVGECIDIQIAFYAIPGPNDPPLATMRVCPCSDIPCDANLRYCRSSDNPFQFTFDAYNHVSWLDYGIDFGDGTSCPMPCTLPITHTYGYNANSTVHFEAMDINGNGCYVDIQICTPDKPIFEDKRINNENPRLLTSAFDMKLYPNPANTISTLSFNLSEIMQMKIELFDIYGRRIRVIKNEVMNPGIHNIEIDIHDLVSGMYVIKVLRDAETTSEHLSIIK